MYITYHLHRYRYLKCQLVLRLVYDQVCHRGCRKICKLSSVPLPVRLLWSFTSLYFFFKFFILLRHWTQVFTQPFSLSLLAIVENTTLFLTAPSNSCCILLSPQIASSAFTSLSFHTVDIVQVQHVQTTHYTSHNYKLRRSCLHARLIRINPDSIHLRMWIEWIRINPDRLVFTQYRKRVNTRVRRIVLMAITTRGYFTVVACASMLPAV